ncbi:MAG: hypothetical protein JXA83_06530, partial [Acidimicrobiales bacterium]|nr:hypothetical protein [Acidimicrobiales bacterium]
RQLDFITELESNEGDPDTLANLFRLDHLATRMRRNAESLLVLAGVEPPRQWAAPVRITDVIRAALGEVESYQRVAVRGVEAATILGSAAADLAHLLAELIENALVFSPPDRSVDVRGRMREDGAYTLAIIDSGLGMPPADITAANRRLAGAESFTVAPSKYLGHYVAGNLAARHGIDVRLDNSPGNGITATITVPPTLLTTDEVTSAPVTPPHGQRAVRAPALPSSLPGPGHPPAAAAGSTPAGGVPFGPGAGPGQHPPTVPSPSEPVPSWAAPLPPAAPHQHPPAAGTPDPWAPHHDQRAPAPDAAPPWAAPDRNPGAPFPPGGDPRHTAPGRPVPEPPAPPASTRSGLARRTPVPRVLSAPPPAEDAALLSALGRYAPGARSGPARPVAPSAPGPSGDRPREAPPLPHRADPAPPGPSDSPFTPPDALTRRVKGAQLPRSTVVSLHGEGRQGSGHRTARGRAPEPSRAADVQSLLSSFTAGVQRGLDEARQRAAATGTGPVQVVDLRTEHGSPGHL